MARQRLDLHEGDVAVLARALGTSGETLRGELERRPWYVNEILRRPEVIDSILGGSDMEQLAVSPLLFFAVLVHRSADELTSSEWVDDWVGPGCRLPVFDVEPLLEFADAPGRLLFTAKLLVGFAVPTKAPVPVDRLDLDDLVDWLGAVEPTDQIVLLRLLGDLALFQAGVFPDSNGATTLSDAQAEHLGRSVGMTDDELDQLVDHGSSTPGLDALEILSSAWYRAAAESSASTPVLLRDVAHRIRAARRFLNYVADHYLHRVQPSWALGA
ncbi:MAG: hypothetical protein OEU32_10905 [Acidimicrobiia bacterium]|nr:hypothetical protein [Acidimicrobiia bacterium]